MNEDLKKFAVRLRQEPALLERLNQSAEPEKGIETLVQMGAELGYHFTPADIKAAGPEGDDLTEAQLEAVAGGVAWPSTAPNPACLVFWISEKLNC